jgi:hypothetical protein
VNRLSRASTRNGANPSSPRRGFICGGYSKAPRLHVHSPGGTASRSLQKNLRAISPTPKKCLVFRSGGFITNTACGTECTAPKALKYVSRGGIWVG